MIGSDHRALLVARCRSLIDAVRNRAASIASSLRVRTRAHPKSTRIALAGAGTLLLLAGLDLAFPPDMTRYLDRSVEIRSSDGRLLRAYLSTDDKWRLGVT